MATPTRPRVEHYRGLQYSFNVIADPEGGYAIFYPDLPGCMTQAETLEEIPAMAEDARVLWIETSYDQGHEIPLPSYPEEHGRTLSVRLPRSLHRSLKEAAEREGVSLNQYIVDLLSRGNAQARLEQRLEKLGDEVE